MYSISISDCVIKSFSPSGIRDTDELSLMHGPYSVFVIQNEMMSLFLLSRETVDEKTWRVHAACAGVCRRKLWRNYICLLVKIILGHPVYPLFPTMNLNDTLSESVWIDFHPWFSSCDNQTYDMSITSGSTSSTSYFFSSQYFFGYVVLLVYRIRFLGSASVYFAWRCRISTRLPMT